MYNRGTSPFEEKFFISIKSSTMKTFSLCLFLLTLSFNVFSQGNCPDTSELNTMVYTNPSPGDGSTGEIIFTAADSLGPDSLIDISAVPSALGDILIVDSTIQFNPDIDSGLVACVQYSFLESGTPEPISLSTFFTINIPSGGGIEVLGDDIIGYSVFDSTVLDHRNFDGTTLTINNNSGSSAPLVLYTREVSSLEICYVNADSMDGSTYALNSSTLPEGDPTCLTPDGSPLAINFLEFLASVNDESSVDLSWTAVDEGQGVYDIEFSANGYDYSVLDQVTAISTNSRSAASSYDKTVAWPEGTNAGYFRLKHTDLDGEITYTKSIQLSLSEALTDISAYPVPTHGILNIKADKAAKLQESIKIYDMLGSLVYEEENDSNANINTSIDISSLISGVYILKIGEYTQRIQKL